MGQAAVISPVGNPGLRLLLMAVATYDWADEQYVRMGLEVSSAAFICVKNPMNFRLGYMKYFETAAQLEGRAMPVDIPGPTSPFLSALPYKRLARPIWFPDQQEVMFMTRTSMASNRQRRPVASLRLATTQL